MFVNATPIEISKRKIEKIAKKHKIKVKVVKKKKNKPKIHTFF